MDFIRFKTDLLLQEAQGDPIKLSKLVHSIVCSIAVVPDEITRTLYMRETASMLGMEEKVLVAAISKQMSLYRAEQKKRKQNEERREANSLKSTVPAENSSFPEAANGQQETDAAATSQENPAEKAAADAQADEDSKQILSFIQKNSIGQDRTFYEKELLLVQILIRYGEHVVCYVENELGEEVPFTATEFVFYALQEDKLSFQVALHQRILDEAMEHIHEAGFSSQKYFLNHADQAVSSLAFQLMSDKYQLSKYHTKNQSITSDEERLFDLVRHLMTDFKLAVIDEELKEILNRLRDPLILKDKEAYMKVMKHYMEVKEIESTLAKERGDRVITSIK